MKLFSHIAAGIGVGSLASLLTSNHYGAFLYTAILSFAVNIVIDLGHTKIQGVVVRSPYTHEVTNCLLVSLAVGIALWMVLGNLYGVSLYVSLLASLLIAGSHLLGDVITRGGIYVRVGASMLRISLSSHSYSDPIANLLYIVLLSLPLIVSLGVVASNPGEMPWFGVVEKIVEIYRLAE